MRPGRPSTEERTESNEKKRLKPSFGPTSMFDFESSRKGFQIHKMLVTATTSLLCSATSRQKKEDRPVRVLENSKE
jgi:hypothetical protein